MVRIIVISALAGILLAGPLRADLSVLCDRAAIRASEATGVPLSVLKAIALTETGRPRNGEMRPWPWTVNMEGQGAWFDTRQEALDFVHAHHRRGAESFDIGCFQVNYRWHGMHFATIEQMFDPEANALYAARFLRDLFQELGGWDQAAGAYHSRTPEYASRYRARFAVFRARFLAEDGLRHILPDLPPDHAAPRRQRTRINTYPLLIAGQGGRMGSLVAVAEQAGAPMGGLFLAAAGARPLIDTEEMP
ncbi:lytic transglycosylase domain-containing protein [Plastorhodobacter daqingensis]|uniref:Lytic transglycosylase domain-containing protein n=1 Tax=Plastorhodobacter daqingensis TaxID=1387281 RepID=A0ABW2UD54_9RHOB